jgi:hypothetical protein
LYVGGSAKVNEIAAAKGIDPAEVEKMLASFYGRPSAKSPVEQRVDVCKRYWQVFDAVHAAQSPGMHSLWGFVDEGATYSPGSAHAYEPQARPHLLPDAVADEIEELWDSEIVKRWPERIVSTLHPHTMFADTFGTALRFWQTAAIFIRRSPPTIQRRRCLRSCGQSKYRSLPIRACGRVDQQQLAR